MHKSKPSYSNSDNKRPRIEFNSKHVKGKKKHARMKTELVGGAKRDNNQAPHNFDNGDSSPFEKSGFNKRGGRRNNLSIERTFDFFGFGSSNQQNNAFNFNASNTDISGLFKTMNAGQRNKNKNFISAAEAMGGDANGGGLQKSNSIFSRSFGFTQSFHNRHNSAAVPKNGTNRFETEVENRRDSLENSKLPEQ